jgi:general secretion pathway protein E
MLKDGLTGEFLSHLQNCGKIDDAGFLRISAISHESMEPVEHIILDLGLLGEPILADELASFLGHKRIAADELVEPATHQQTFPASYLRQANLVLLEENHSHFTVATATPLSDEYIRAMCFQSGRSSQVKVTERSAILKHLRSSQPEDQSNRSSDEDEDLKREDIERLKDAARDGPTIKLLNHLIGDAVDQSATDIHIEPREDRVVVRYRIDGTMQAAEQLTKETQSALCSRIKILAAMNIAETRLPQDGRMRVVHKGRPVDLRVASSPVVHGENIVLRILDRQTTALDLEALGYTPSDANRVHEITNTANGLFLVTGPTGSGKSTTLYAVLTRLNSSSQKLFSIEDPIEIRVEGVSQIQVKPQINFDFPEALRAILRQDPDVVMVGEMRDAETAKIALRASITGHMVLSTLHTNSAVGAISRLRDMGIENYLIAASLKGILAQRLVRKACQCLNQDSACTKCQGSGFAGRTVVYELLVASERFLKAISAGADEASLQVIASEEGMVGLAKHATKLVQLGATKPSEILRLGIPAN